MTNVFNILMVSIFMALCFAGSALAETMYAKKDRVKVTSEKSPKSKVVATLRLGDAVDVLKKSGRQYKVKLGSGATGWVFKFKLSEKKPSGKSGGSGLSALTGKSTVVAQEARAGGSIRGLKETTEQYAERKHISPVHRRSVDKMEQFVITDEELNRFKQDGGVGEYAGGGQ